MSFFGPRFPTTGGDFAPLFRLLDDYSAHANSGYSSSRGGRSFQPRFDVKEVNNSYELQGELPGIDQGDIHIEFTDPTTLVIKGRTERTATSGAPPTATAVEDKQPAATTGEITNAESGNDEPAKADNYHKASVQDEGSEAATTGDAVNTPTTSTTTETGDATAVTQQQQQQPKTKKRHHDGSRYWVSERSVGEFQRSFSFPSRVDQDAVTASLKNGILSVVVPKAAAHQSRRITVE